MSTVSLKLQAKKNIIKTEKRDDFESLNIPPVSNKKNPNKTIKPTHYKTKKYLLLSLILIFNTRKGIIHHLHVRLFFWS